MEFHLSSASPFPKKNPGYVTCGKIDFFMTATLDYYSTEESKTCDPIEKTTNRDGVVSVPRIVTCIVIVAYVRTSNRYAINKSQKRFRFCFVFVNVSVFLLFYFLEMRYIFSKISIALNKGHFQSMYRFFFSL